VWMTIKTYGAQRLRKTIQEDIEKADYLVKSIHKSNNFEVMAPAPLSIVCFRYNPGGKNEEELSALNDAIIRRIEEDGRIFLTGTKIKKKTALRACFINHRTTQDDINFALQVISEIAQSLQKHT